MPPGDARSCQSGRLAIHEIRDGEFEIRVAHRGGEAVQRAPANSPARGTAASVKGALPIRASMTAVGPGSAPARLIGVRVAQQFLDIGLDDSIAYVSIELLASLVQDHGRAALHLEAFGVLVVRVQ
jgi:hypothetical protein